MNHHLKLQAVQTVLETESAGLRHFILSKVHSPTEAEDILQTGFIRCLEKAPELKDASKARPWVISVFRNLAFDFLREKQRNALLLSPIDPNALEEVPDSKENTAQDSVCSCATELLQELPKKYSHILQEVEVEGESVKQLAKDLNYSPNKLSVQLHRARQLLKTALKKKCQVETYESCLECDC